MGAKVTRHLLLSIAFFAVAFSGLARSADNPVKIGTTQSLTGHYSEFGIEQLRGMQMWAADVNSRGALLGRTVEIVYYDDQSRDAGTVEGFTKLIVEDKVDLLIGPYSSSLTLEASLVAEKYDIPMISTAASSEEIWNRGLKNIFGADTPASDYLDGIHLAADVGAKTVAIVYAETEFGTEVAASARLSIETGRLLLIEGYAPEQRDFKGLAQRLKEVDPDLIFGVSYLEDSVAIVRDIKAAGVKPRMLGFTIGPGLREFADQLDGAQEGVVGVVQWLRGSREPGAQDFAYRFSQRYGYNPGVYAVLGYSAGEIIEASVRLAGTTDHEAVREQLRTMYFRALIGTYDVTENGRQKNRRNYVLQWQDDKRVLVAPENIAENAFVYPLP
ncbi:MAG: amino acid ABC transporter substrate-binding protein [Halioglobus sp.]|nr:amino acid ABC transporter substrate-binding protein [Halioglobus sp.]